MFSTPNPRQSFPSLENEVIQYWKEHDTFKKSLELRKDAPEYVFYDGPPFATGTPHYGHILAGVIKDVVPRYWTMRGRYVERRFGWDCHGLPIENIVEKKLGISGKKDIEEKVGVFEFNEQCRANVFSYVDEWRRVVERTGRWVDMDNDYKTLDTSFMESVWGVFKSVYDKGLIYESHRVVPYCPRCSTPLSNFEVNQGYEDKQDKAVTVKFKVVGNASKYVLAWTTTPWTLPANLGLAVGEDITYAEILDNASGDTYVLAKDRVTMYYKNEADYTFVREYPGSCLVGLEYEPLFDDARTKSELGELPKGQSLGKNVYHVVSGHHVTTDSGTGVVHIAPAFGEDDFQIGEKSDLGFFSHIDATGNTEGLLSHNGTYVFDYNQIVIDRLKAEKSLVHIGTIDHSYPHCYRCGTPLIYRAISAWYVNVESIKDKMLAANDQINWVPETIKTGRFGKWLEGARDWNISRNRYWGSALPVWKSEDGDIMVIGSIAELAEYNKEFGQIALKDGVYTYVDSGKEIDLHKHFVDQIKLSKNGKTYTRIPEVLDCWFESGSMPYAQKHYPFENKERFEKTFPADFICEGLDQTRGWFYTLTILAAALFDKPAFQNVIVNGIILAEDGKKMSKSLKNYPDPMGLLERQGADAMRFYLMNSGAVRADELKFSEAGVEEVTKKVILPLWNTLSFFTTYANVDGWSSNGTQVFFARHGETNMNMEHRVSDGLDNSPLNETGRAQALESAKRMKEEGREFDVILASPLLRAYETAEIFAKEFGHTDSIVVDEDFVEKKTEKYSGKEYKQILEDHFKETGIQYKKSVELWGADDSTETVEQFEERVIRGYKKALEMYPGKKILIVAHGGVFLILKRGLYGIAPEVPTAATRLKNAEVTELPSYVMKNPLDRFIMSELQVLTGKIHDGFESYDLQKATRAITEFMDDLTNWYVRRSRRRFWGSGINEDKNAAYETLYRVLTDLCKLLAPFAPFVSEHVFRLLTGKESVHLERMPNFERHLVATELLVNMNKAKDLVNLGLALRSKKKLRVRQPLASVTIGESLDAYFLEIIKEELNVKEVLVADMSKIASRIAKPNARLIGPKFGKNVQRVITQAKLGKFELGTEGKIYIESDVVGEEGWVLEAGEYEIAYEPTEGASVDVEGGFGTVVAMDTVVTKELELEGLARDLIRMIQDARKEADYQVSDRISLCISGEASAEIRAKHGEYIASETLATLVDSMDAPDLEKTDEEIGITIAVKR